MVNGYADFNIDFAPQAIELLSTYYAGSTCYTACFNDDGHLYVGWLDGVTLYSKAHDGSYDDSKLYDGIITSIKKATGDEQYFLIDHSEEVKTVCETTDFITLTQVFKLDCPCTNDKKAAVGSIYIAATCESSVVFFNRKTGIKTTRMLHYNPTDLLFLSDDSLLVSDGYVVRKYRIEHDANLQLQWTCEGLEDVRGMSILKDEMIVAISDETGDGKLYIVSKDGKNS